MKRGIRLVCLLFLLTGFSVSRLFAQDLTGIWRGHFRSNNEFDRLAGNYDDRYKMEVQIAQTHNHFEAITYSYKNTEFYGKAEATGTLNAETKKVLLKEGKLLEVRFATGGVCIMTCFMQYSKLGDDEYLQGTYYSTSVNDSTAGCGKGSIFLHRVANSDFHKEPLLEKREKELSEEKKTTPEKSSAETPVKPESKSVAAGTTGAKAKTTPKPVAPKNTPLKNTASNATKAKTGAPKTSTPHSTAAHKPARPAAVTQNVAVQKPANQTEPQTHQNGDSIVKIKPPDAPVIIPNVLRTRTNSLLKTYSVTHNTIELRIYDDGAIDNDTVSVYYDNKLIISKARLSDQAITTHITVEPSDHPHQLVMVAENLGDIPPNTSLLVVVDGDKKYEERIISTEQKNVVINFLYKKPE
jgi:hypothetical protein